MTKRERARIIALEAKLRGQSLERARELAAREGIHGTTAAAAWNWRASRSPATREAVPDAAPRFWGRNRRPGRLTMREIRRLGRGLPDVVCLAAALEAYAGVGQWAEGPPFPTLDQAPPEWRPLLDELVERSQVEVIVWWSRPGWRANGVAHLGQARDRVTSAVRPGQPETLRARAGPSHPRAAAATWMGSSGWQEVEVERFVIDTLAAHGIDAGDGSRRYVERHSARARW